MRVIDLSRAHVGASNWVGNRQDGWDYVSGSLLSLELLAVLTIVVPLVVEQGGQWLVGRGLMLKDGQSSQRLFTRAKQHLPSVTCCSSSERMRRGTEDSRVLRSVGALSN